MLPTAFLRAALPPALSILLLSPLLQAQVASALLKEGQPLTGAPPGHVISGALIELSGNQAGGFAVGVNTTDGVTTLSHIWGSATGANPGILRTEGLFDNINQTSFETWFGISNAGQVCYSPLGVDQTTLLSGDYVFVDSVAVAKDGEPIPSLPGKKWRFGSRPDITADGRPYWGGGIDDIATGANQGYGVFLGANATVVFKSGDVLPGMNAPVGNSIDFDYRFSALASHWISHVNSTAGTAQDGHVIMDGALLHIAGMPVLEGQPVPAAAGGMAGENWAFFDYFGVNEAGDYMITGDTSAATTIDEFLLVNGVIRYREGDVIDGYTVTGPIEDARMDEAGNIAYVWLVVTPAGNRQAAFFNGTLVIKQGDAVDMDGDGVPEPGSIVVDLDTLLIASDGTLYLTADIDINGTSSTTDDVQTLFRLGGGCPSPSTYCTAKVSSSGCVPSIGSTGTATPSGNLTATATQIEASQLGVLFHSTHGSAAIAFQDGTLCVSPPVIRLPFSNSGGSLPCTGTYAAPLTSVVQGLPAGTQVWSQFWFRDPGANSGTGLSNGLTFTTCP